MKQLVSYGLFAALDIVVHGLTTGLDQVKRQEPKGTATINAEIPIGTPEHLASGFLYGIPVAQNQVPDHFYTEMGFAYGRAGGGSQPEPARGWAYGADEFTVRPCSLSFDTNH